MRWLPRVRSRQLRDGYFASDGWGAYADDGLNTHRDGLDNVIECGKFSFLAKLAPASEEGRQLCKSSPESVMVTDLLVSPKVCEFRGVLLLSEAVYFGELDDFAVRILFGDDLRA